jgi:hypothetical protein
LIRQLLLKLPHGRVFSYIIGTKNGLGDQVASHAGRHIDQNPHVILAPVSSPADNFPLAAVEWMSCMVYNNQLAKFHGSSF